MNNRSFSALAVFVVIFGFTLLALVLSPCKPGRYGVGDTVMYGGNEREIIAVEREHCNPQYLLRLEYGERVWVFEEEVE